MSNLLSNYFLVLVVGGLAVDIHRRQYLEGYYRNTGWVVSFSLFALASLLGGTYHGFLEGSETMLPEVIWFSTIACIQLASFALAVTVVEQFLTSSIIRRVVEVLLLIKLVGILGWLAIKPQFIYVIVGYGIDLILVLTVLTYAMVRHRSGSLTWTFLGALIVPVASIIQQLPFTVFGTLDQNDIYHFVLSGAFVCFYLGIKRSGGTFRAERRRER